MGLMSVGGGLKKKISSYVLIETTSTDSNDAAVKLSYYENDVLKETVTKLFTQVSPAFTFHYVTLSYGSEKWYLRDVSSNGPYDSVDSKAGLNSMITSGFTGTSWSYLTSVAKIVYQSDNDISKVTIGYLQSVFGG